VSWFWSKKTYFKFSNNSSKRMDLTSPISRERSQLDPSISKIKKGVIRLEKKIISWNHKKSHDHFIQMSWDQTSLGPDELGTRRARDQTSSGPDELGTRRARDQTSSGPDELGTRRARDQTRSGPDESRTRWDRDEIRTRSRSDRDGDKIEIGTRSNRDRDQFGTSLGLDQLLRLS
jgi:hypothetical protein